MATLTLALTFGLTTPDAIVTEPGTEPISNASGGQARAVGPGSVTVSRYRGHTAAEWAAKFRHRTRQLQVARAATKTLRRTLVHRPEAVEAINLTCAVYGWCTTLWRKADCESGLSPRAHNSSGASGLYQFLPSTWATTPFGRFSIWSPYANALAAGWMHVHGRGGEWVCR